MTRVPTIGAPAAEATPEHPAATSNDHGRAPAGPIPTHPPGDSQGRTERTLGAALPIVLAVGVFCVAFVHVHDVAAWAGQPDWAAWLIAVSVELMALASIIEIRHRRRTGTPIRWPVGTLLAGVAMSGAANLTAAGPHALTATPGAWIPTMALWPVAAFGLVAGLKASRPTRPAPATSIKPPTTTDPASEDRPAADAERADRSAGADSSAPTPDPLPADLLAAGRAVAADLARRGRPVTRTALVRGVRQRGQRCSTDRAALLLAAVRHLSNDPKPPQGAEGAAP
ncbi:membrane hypothetical protein [Parafrankia sp. Ea1.12]|uniref:DUF2637 domain-containing protein n=1 Tax=Parafrankia sp. Ea1.12 TaxID=573499 RepID=UPI000DA5BA15|nr:DUF2637 domain-containing protein [Parafrankia sp. Ea1.12]SQD94564.1 membrane hypothetical protein [Parafrankia sp. Ea1.12]